MGIHNNSPTLSWIKLDGISVTKGEDIYTVRDFKTNLKYIYWSSDTPSVLTASNVMQVTTSSKFLIVVNNKGECVVVPNNSIKVSFDGNSIEAISNNIWSIHEKNNEFDNKFVAVEQDINGIRQTVGATNEELGTLTEHVSKIEQSANEIDLSVKELNREYTNNKEMLELRESVNKVIINVNSSIGVFKAKVTETFKDNNITEDEGVEIQANITIVRERTEKVVEEVDRVIAIMQAGEHLENVNKLISAKTAFTTAIDNLISLVNTAISDEIIVPTEITVVTTAFAKASLEINTLKNTLDEMIFLGVGGTVSEELARISMKSDEIVLSVNKVEETVKNDTDFIKGELTTQIKDVNDALGSLETTMNTSFLDGVLSESEKISIKQTLNTLLTEKVDIDKQYETVYGNTGLEGEAKTALKTAYDNYTSKCTNLSSVIDAILNKDGNLDETDKTSLDNALADYRTSLGVFSEKINQAIDAIAESKTNKVDKKYAEILLTPDGIVSKVGKLETTTTEHGNQITSAESSITQLADRISSKVSAGEVSSIIEQSSDEIRYGFNNISDYVVISRSGLSVNRGIIACSAIGTPEGTHPIIKLFPQSDGSYCSLDATEQYEEGKGNAIRLKWDRMNYLSVFRKGVDMYMEPFETGASFKFRADHDQATLGSKFGDLRMSSNGIYYQGSKLSTGSVAWGDISGKPSSFNPSSHDHDGSTMTLRNCNAYNNGSGNVGWSAEKWGQVSAVNIWGDGGNISDMKFKENIHYIGSQEETPQRMTFNSSSDTGEEEIIKPNEQSNVNIGVIPTDLHDFIKNDLRLCEYNYTKEYLGQAPTTNFENKLGFIAQDLVGKKVGNLIVGEHEGNLAYNLNNYVSVIAGALQIEIQKGEERDSKISSLEKENTLLKQELSDIKDMISQLLQNK